MDLEASNPAWALPATCSTRYATPDTTQILHDWHENWREQPFRAPLLWASATPSTTCTTPKTQSQSYLMCMPLIAREMTSC
jgi:hypothetical protein